MKTDEEKLYGYSQDVLDETVRCIKCNAPIVLVYDPDIRDTCSPCGGFSKLDNDDDETNEKEDK